MGREIAVANTLYVLKYFSVLSCCYLAVNKFEIFKKKTSFVNFRITGMILECLNFTFKSF